MFIKENVVREYEGKEFRSEMVFGVGNLTADVNIRKVNVQGEEKSTLDGRSSIAFNTKVKGEDVAIFYQLDAWDKTAEILADYGKKGRRMFVSGKVKEEEYTNKDGEKRTGKVLKVERFRFLDFDDNKKDEVKEGETDFGGFQPTDDDDIPF